MPNEVRKSMLQVLARVRGCQRGDSLECAGPAALWSMVARRRVVKKQSADSKRGYKRWAKEAPGRRTPRRCFLAMVSDRFGLALARGPGQSSGGGDRRFGRASSRATC